MASAHQTPQEKNMTSTRTSTVTESGAPRAPRTPISRVARRLLGAVPIVVAAATVAGLGLYYAAGILYPDVTAWAGAGPLQIVIANLVYFTVGALGLLFLVRFTQRPARAFVVVSALALVSSFGAPISAAFGTGSAADGVASIATVVTLSLLHVVSYAVGVPLLLRLALTTKEA